MRPRVKPVAAADDRIDRRPDTPEHLIRELAVAPFGGRIVGRHDEQIVVAVGSGVAPGLRAEELDALWLVRCDETAHDLRKDGILNEECVGHV